jgi:hypothetical protein
VVMAQPGAATLVVRNTDGGVSDPFALRPARREDRRDRRLRQSRSLIGWFPTKPPKEAWPSY